MMRKKKYSIKFLIFAVGLLATCMVHAHDLLEVYTLAKENDPTFQAQVESELASEELKYQARAGFFPKVAASQSIVKKHYKGAVIPSEVEKDLSAEFPFRDIDFPNTNQNFATRIFSLKLVQPIFYYHEWIKYGKADIEVQNARATLAAAELDLITRTVERFFGVLRARDALHFAESERRALEKFFNQTNERYKEGLIPITDVTIAQARRDIAFSKEIAAKTELQNQKERLKEITGCLVESFPKLRMNVSFNPPDPNCMEEWVDGAIEHNLSLIAKRFSVDTARTDIKIESGGHLPNLNIVSGIDHSAADPFTTKSTISSVGLQLDFPIFSGGSVLSKTRQARHLYEKTLQEYEKLYRETESNTIQHFRNVLTQIAQINALKQAVISNQSALQATESAFGVGTRTIVDVLDSQTNLIKAELDFANAKYDYILQSFRLKQWAGILTPEDVCHINSWLE